MISFHQADLSPEKDNHGSKRPITFYLTPSQTETDLLLRYNAEGVQVPNIMWVDRGLDS